MRILSVLLVALCGCSLDLDRPDCLGKSEAIQGACLIDGTPGEAEYVGRVLALLGGNYPVDIHLKDRIDSVHQIYVDSFASDGEFDFCISGFSFDGEIWAIPTALAHELVHFEVAERTGLLQRNEIRDYSTDIVERSRLDHEAQGWTEEDFLRVRWANAYAAESLPYEIEQGCSTGATP